MARFVDGFVLPLPKKNIAAYKKLARKASRIWKDHGALEYMECVGADLKIKGIVQFPKLAKAKPSETVVFAWIIYKSRAHRDRVNAKVMKDPRVANMCNAENHPFDFKRMCYGGFDELVRG
jgi:uncharacterized protein YbaA (DUF1428 family)